MVKLCHFAGGYTGWINESDPLQGSTGFGSFRKPCVSGWPRVVRHIMLYQPSNNRTISQPQPALHLHQVMFQLGLTLKGTPFFIHRKRYLI